VTAVDDDDATIGQPFDEMSGLGEWNDLVMTACDDRDGRCDPRQ
jgi:hypothetical protein